MPLSDLLTFDKEVKKSAKKHFLVGIDEVGRGALAGPVTAGAFCWKKNNQRRSKSLEKLNDSKQLKVKDREELYEKLEEISFYSIGEATVKEVDKLNVLNATYLAMKRAYEGLIEKVDFKELQPYVLVDGNKFNPYINARQICVIDGDAKSAVIAGASIMAKVTRDSMMQELSKKRIYKHYGFESNVGYGTKLHRDAIREHGVTKLHRKLFVRKTLALK